MSFTLKVGLEIHGYIKSAKKLFCNCDVVDEATPNTHICPICTGQPGSKPMLTNADALEKAIAIGLMLGCRINENLLFQRKHYSWPDSPNNFQRTMSGSYAVPVGENGTFEGIRITQVHLEEDPARWDPVTGEIDYNRAGTPLIEIVTEPDFTESEQVREWLQKLVTTLSYIKVLNKTAGIKSDVNVSISPDFERVEIKNVNSQSAIVEAIGVESKRQSLEKQAGNNIPMQTRTYDSATKETLFMRSKENAQDYMFIPDPDIPFITITPEFVAQLQESLPETPSVKEANLKKLGVKDDDAQVLSQEFELIVLFEKLAQKQIPIKTLVTYLRREAVGVANYHKKELADLVFDEVQIGELLTVLSQGKITDQTAREVFQTLLLKPFDVKSYIAEKGLLIIEDSSQLDTWCSETIAEQSKAVADYKSGQENALNFLVGQVMKKSRGTAKVDVVKQKFIELLG